MGAAVVIWLAIATTTHKAVKMLGRTMIEGKKFDATPFQGKKEDAGMGKNSIAQ